MTVCAIAIMATRNDRGRIFKSERCDNGSLRFWMAVSKVGDLVYRNDDGSDRIEYVPKDTLFDPDSLKTAWGKPITIGHPNTGRVDLSDKTPGMTQQGMIIDGDFLTIVGVLNDPIAIDAAEKGCQISAGYSCDVVEREDGKLEQRNRNYNHFALVPFGRAGEDVRVRIDAADAVTDADAQHLDRQWTAREREALAEGKIKGAFAASGNRYPIATGNDVKDAWNMAGQSKIDDPDKIRRNVIRIAKDLGLVSSLPETALTWAKQRNITLDAMPDNNTTTLRSVELGGIDFRVDMDLAAAIASLKQTLAALESQASEASAEKAEMEMDMGKKMAEYDAKVDALQAKLDAAESNRMDSDAIAAEVKTRLEAWAKVQPALTRTDAKFAPDYSLGANAIKRLYLDSVCPELAAKADRYSSDEAKAAYLDALFENAEPKTDEAAVNAIAKTDAQLDNLNNATAAPRMDVQSELRNRRATRSLPGLGAK